MITSTGGDIKIDKTCFLENQLGGISTGKRGASVLLKGAATASSISGKDNYARIWNGATSQECLFAGEDTGGDSVECVGSADAQECMSSKKDVEITWG